MFNPVKFCFKHDRIRSNVGIYLQLERDSFWKLARARVHVQNEPCDKCTAIAKLKEEDERGHILRHPQ